MTSQFNSSQEIVFVLHGLNVTQENRHINFVFILILYLFTIFVNLILIFTIFLENMLQTPMYLFLCNLCFNGIIGASSFYPKILYDILFDSHVITYIGCLTQILVIYFYVYCEFTHLTVMAYDRYVAICKPLHYQCIMTIRKVWTLILLTWLFSLLEVTIGIVVKLSCIDTTLNNINGFIFTSYQFLQTIFILVSYVNIIKASLRSQAGRKKFMQTCLPHLITLINFSISLLFDLMYARYGSNTSLLALRNIMAVEFLVVPLLNPIIYGMNLSQIQNRVRKMFNCKVSAVSKKK
uniref:G-protein coupled receptors family 1 profile domain-containing protein n=1 Tax=Esox lucius TaxID=8010 RepID=A0AAY5K2W5_ESOLU